eukprot:TRINITY_DN5748_c0_g1_i7.p1 TRINITY_DN5748_c0_g1~~TRINITY_DN5748_c0_g1_i7.p1  ORF type:complete len:323 (+),score=74.59 TRINITY_DN5748_c0_g1_i7:144-1112(+)
MTKLLAFLITFVCVLNSGQTYKLCHDECIDVGELSFAHIFQEEKEGEILEDLNNYIKSQNYGPKGLFVAKDTDGTLVLKTESGIETDEAYITANQENTLNYQKVCEKDQAYSEKSHQINQNDDALRSIKNPVDQLVVQLFWHIANIQNSEFKPFLRALPRDNLPLYLRIRPSELDQLEKEQFLYQEIFSKRKEKMRQILEFNTTFNDYHNSLFSMNYKSQLLGAETAFQFTLADYIWCRFVVEEYAWYDKEANNRGFIIPPYAFIKKQDDPDRSSKLYKWERYHIKTLNIINGEVKAERDIPAGGIILESNCKLNGSPANDQ